MNLRILITTCALATVGCTDVRSKIVASAESTRSATEQLAARSAAAANLRQGKIIEQAGPINRAQAIELGERYYLEASPTGWTVVDSKTDQPARLEANKDLEGLSIDEAREALRVLEQYGDGAS